MENEKTTQTETNTTTAANERREQAIRELFRAILIAKLDKGETEFFKSEIQKIIDRRQTAQK